MTARSLTVEISVDGGVLRRTLHAGYLHEALPEQRLDEVGLAYAAGNRRGVDALRHVLEAGDEATVGAHLAGQPLARAGEALFELLFGVRRDGVSTFLQRLFDGDGAPTRHPLRVRILTSAEDLLCLPWGITAWRGWFLRNSGWTFEVVDALSPSESLRLKAPTTLLLILPGLDAASDPLGTAGHRDAVAEVVDTYFRAQSQRSDRFAIARTREEVARSLTDLKPSIVYFYGHGAVHPEPGLVVRAERLLAGKATDPWSADEIARTICDSGAPVQIAYLNGCMTGRGGWGSVGRRLLDVVPVVLAHPTTSWSVGATATAIRWFRRLFGAEDDPVTAAFHRDAHEPMTALGWLPLLAFTRHLTFRVERDQTDVRRPPRGIDLDRHLQREQAGSQVRQLALRPERRVQGFLALGPPNNHPEDVARQLHRFIEDLDPRLELHMTEPLDVSASLLRNQKQGPADLGGRLRVALGADWNADLKATLEEKAPPRISRRHRILWLDWRVLRGLPVKDDVTGWMAFCSGHLVPGLPAGVDAVVTLALEVPAPEIERVQALLDRLANDPAHRRDELRFTVLPPLGKAPLGEVLQFLDDARCPQGLRDELARLLLEVTGGDYALLRQQIEVGLAETWVDLARKLRMLRTGGGDPDEGL